MQYVFWDVYGACDCACCCRPSQAAKLAELQQQLTGVHACGRALLFECVHVYGVYVSVLCCTSFLIYFVCFCGNIDIFRSSVKYILLLKINQIAEVIFLD